MVLCDHNDKYQSRIFTANFQPLSCYQAAVTTKINQALSFSLAYLVRSIVFVHSSVGFHSSSYTLTTIVAVQIEPRRPLHSLGLEKHCRLPHSTIYLCTLLDPRSRTLFARAVGPTTTTVVIAKLKAKKNTADSPQQHKLCKPISSPTCQHEHNTAGTFL